MKVVVKSRGRKPGTPLSPAEHQQRIEAARSKAKTRSFLGKHYKDMWDKLRSYSSAFSVYPSPEQHEAVLDDVASYMLEGFRDFEDARLHVKGRKPRDLAGYSPIGRAYNVKQMQWAIDRKQAQIDKLKSVKVVSPTGRIGTMEDVVMGLSKLLSKRKR